MSQDVLKKIATYDADIIAIQETKLPAEGPSDKHLELLKSYFPSYNFEWVSSVPPAKKGYAGTMILYKEGLKAEKLVPKLGAPDTMDDEGRLIALEFDNFYFVNVYTPNSGDGLRRLKERQQWDALYADYLSSLDKTVPPPGRTGPATSTPARTKIPDAPPSLRVPPDGHSECRI